MLDEEGFAAAGRRLHLSPASVTERVHRLEHELGAAILVRAPLMPTEAGAILEPFARQIVGQADELVLEIAGRPGRLVDFLSVGLMAGGAAELNDPIRRAVQRVLPRCRVAWVDLPLADTEASIVDGRVDVAILRSPVQHIILETVQLFEAHRVVLTAAAGPFAGRRNLTVADLGETPVTGISRQHGQEFAHFFRLAPDRNGEPLPVRYSDTFAESARRVLSGQAVAVPSADAARIFAFPPILTTVPLLGASPSGAIGVCRRGDRRRKVRLFMRVLREVALHGQNLIPDVLPLPS